MYQIAEIYRFKTRNFLLVVDAVEETDPDLSWDETGETREKLERGDYLMFAARVRVIERNTGAELAADYLGNCIYETPAAFMDHRGIKEKARKDGRNYGSYFTDMVRQACKEARTQLCAMQKIPVRC